jgi:hypothetical protein
MSSSSMSEPTNGDGDNHPRPSPPQMDGASSGAATREVAPIAGAAADSAAAGITVNRLLPLDSSRGEEWPQPGADDVIRDSWILISEEFGIRRVRFLLDPVNGDQPGTMQVVSFDGTERYRDVDFYALEASSQEVEGCIGFIWLPSLSQYADGIWFGVNDEFGSAAIMMRPARYAAFLREDLNVVGPRFNECVLPSAAMWNTWRIQYGAGGIKWD